MKDDESRNMREKIYKIMIFLLMCITLCGCGNVKMNEKSPSQIEGWERADEHGQTGELGQSAELGQKDEQNQITEGSEQVVTYEQISQDRAKELMTSEEGYIILDVRTQAEFDEGHIPGAICVPNESIRDEMPAELTDLEQLILVYCRSGNRSKQASQKLAEIGYTNVKEFGGIMSWDGEIE